MRELRHASLIVWLGLAAATNVGAQPGAVGPGTAGRGAFRYELFQMLFEERTQRIVSFSEACFAPEESVVVMVGDSVEYSKRMLEQARAFAVRGGSLLVASDRQCEIVGIASITPGPVKSMEPKVRYQGFDDCLRIRTLNPFLPMMSGIGEIIVNRTGWIETSPVPWFNWQSLAVLPGDCIPIDCRNCPVVVIGEATKMSAATATVVMAADTSLFTNAMLWHGDNAMLAIRVSELLCKGRRRLCFLVDSQVQSSYRESPFLKPPAAIKPPPPIPPGPLPEMDLATLLRLANGVITKVEESNVINEALRDQPRNARPIAYYRFLAMAIASFGAVWLFWKLIRRAVQSTPLPLVRKVYSAHEIIRSRLGLATEMQVAAGTLAREFFKDLTGSDARKAWRQYLVNQSGNSNPDARCEVRRAQLSQILKIAEQGVRGRISTLSFQQIGTTILELRALHGCTKIN